MGKRSNDIISLTNCPCATSEINHYLEEVPFEQRPEGRIHVFGSDKISNIPDEFDKLVIAENTESEANEAAEEEKAEEKTEITEVAATTDNKESNKVEELLTQILETLKSK